VSPISLYPPFQEPMDERGGLVTRIWQQFFLRLQTSNSTGAPNDAQYLVGAVNSQLTAERVVTNTATVTWDLSTPGQAKANAVGATVFKATTTFTDAQIKAMPTSALTLVAAQGAGTRIQLITIDLKGDFAAGAYTNVSTDGFVYASVGVGLENLSSAIANDSTIPLTHLTTIFSAQVSQSVLVPNTYAEPVDNWGNISYVTTVSAASVNQPLYLFINNAAAGNLTGGNAANTLTVNTWYGVIS
jgi:hypothetical protein